VTATQGTIAVCVATYKRPLGLRQLLGSLAALSTPVGWSIEVIVVDNDEEASARTTVQQVESETSMTIVYDVEPRQGIPLVRNRGTELAIERGATWLAYIDDDERAEPAWLVELLATANRHDAPIVAGRVIPEYEAEPPDWVIEIGTFARKTWPDGHELDYAITASVLLDREILGDDTRPFDERLRFSGGSDLQLFNRLYRDGHKIVFSPTALSHELIPQSRMNTGWALKRQYRRGLNRSTTLRLLDFRPRSILKRLIAGAVALMMGAGLWAAGLWRGSTARLKGRLRMAYGRGLLMGLTGRKYDEYKVVHGG